MKTLIVILALSLAAAAQTFTSFQAPKAKLQFAHTIPTAIGKSGAVIGTWSSPPPQYGNGSFLRNSKGKFVTMQHGGVLTPTAINSTGTIVGGYLSTWSFWRTPQGVVTRFKFNSDNNFYTHAVGINDAGTMIGWAGVNGPTFAWVGTPTAWTTIDVVGAVLVGPAAINTFGDVAGFYQDADRAIHGFLWTSTLGTSTFDVPGATGTEILTLDDNGYFSGIWKDAALMEHSFVNDASGLTTFDPVGARQSWVAGRNKNGFIAGGYQDNAQIDHGYRRTPKGVITTIDPPDSVGTNVSGINAGGKIAGYYYDSSGTGHGFIYTP